jgi:hypothetical protein
MICLTVLWEVSCYRKLYVAVRIVLCGGDVCAVTDLELLCCYSMVSLSSCMHVDLKILLDDVETFF